MPSHNKRSKAKDAVNKERRSKRYHRSEHSNNNKNHHQSGRHGGHYEPSYLSTRTDYHQNRGRHTYDNEDPLDRQLFDFLIVVDVEATCQEGQRHYPHEVIELPGVLVDVRTGRVDRKRSFHTYVRPLLNPKLTDFCTSLTGITQKEVDAAPTIVEAVELFEKWYRETIPRGAKVVFASDGPWDFKNFIHEHHVLRDGVSFPSLFYEYLDIRTTFSRDFNVGASMKLENMLQRMGLTFKGRPHNGFDDAYNIARLAVAMMRAGCIFDYLVTIPLTDDHFYHLEDYPLYRRAEGSGRVDRDVVEDIAKSCFGEDYFEFGQQHRAATLAYRAAHPGQFKDGNVVAMKRAAVKSEQQRRQRQYKLYLLVLLTGLGMALLAYWAWKRRA